MVALRSQGNWRWEGPLGTPLGLVHWKRASSPVEAGTAGYLCFQTPIAGSLQTGDKRVRPRLGLMHGAPPASRDVPGERGRLSSCLWNLGFFPNDARKNCPFVLTSFTGWSSERCPCLIGATILREERRFRAKAVVVRWRAQATAEDDRDRLVFR